MWILFCHPDMVERAELVLEKFDARGMPVKIETKPFTNKEHWEIWTDDKMIVNNGDDL
jgi:hypothetical protein